MPQLSLSSPFGNNKNTLDQIPNTDNNIEAISKLNNPAEEAEGEQDTSDNQKMVAREPSITYNETLNNNNNNNHDVEPQQIFPSSEQDEGFIGELMLKDESEEKKRPVAAFRRRLSLGKMKMLSSSALQTSKKSGDNDKNNDNEDNDALSLMSSGSGNSRGRGRASRRTMSMKEALENGSANIRDTIRSKSPSVLRRLRRKDSNDSCHQLVRDDDDDDDDDHVHDNPADNDNSKPEEEGDQPQENLSDTNQVEDDHDDDLSDGEETCYSQFQPSLNRSLRAERSVFVTDNETSLLHPDGDGDPMVVVVTNTGYLSAEGSLDLSIRSEAAETTGSVDHPETESVEKTTVQAVSDETLKTPSRSPKRDRGSLSRRQKGKKSNKDRHSVSPKRNSSLPKNGTRPKRHSTAAVPPIRHSSVPKNAVSNFAATANKRGGDSEHKTNKRVNNKSPRRPKSPKKERNISTSGNKREKSPKREKKKKAAAPILDATTTSTGVETTEE